MRLDRFDTPEAICRDVVKVVDDYLGPSQRRVLDPAAGNGALIAPFLDEKVMWSSVGLDVDPSAVHVMAERWSHGTFHCVDFLSTESCEAVTGEPFDAVVLNPPFSERGMATTEVVFGGRSVSCGRSMAFLLRAVAVVKPDGIVVAILPKSALRADKNQEALALLHRLGSVTPVRSYKRTAFSGAVAETSLVVWHSAPDVDHSCRCGNESRPSRSGEPRTIVRGWVKMHLRRKCRGPWLPLIHTTDLHRFHEPTELRRCRSKRSVVGPAVLLPRVGMIRRDQIVVLTSNDLVCLSDCVLAIRATDGRDALRLAAMLKQEIADLRREYEATGAPYVTLTRLRRWLGERDMSHNG